MARVSNAAGLISLWREGRCPRGTSLRLRSLRRPGRHPGPLRSPHRGSGRGWMPLRGRRLPPGRRTSWCPGWSRTFRSVTAETAGTKTKDDPPEHNPPATVRGVVASPVVFW